MTTTRTTTAPTDPSGWAIIPAGTVTTLVGSAAVPVVVTVTTPAPR